MSVIKRQTILGTIYSYLGVFIGVITQLIIIKFFTTEENGLIQLLMKWMLTLVMFAGLGYNSSGVRFFHYFRNPDKKHNGYLFNGLVALFAGTLLSVLFLYIFQDWIVSSEKEDNQLFIDHYFLIIPITIATVIFNLFDNYAKGLYDTVAGNFLSQFLQRFLIMISAILYISGYLSFQQFIYVWVVAISFPTVLIVVHCIRLGNFSLQPTNFLVTAPFRKEFVRFALFGIITGLSSIIITSLDAFMVYEYLGLGLTGVYSTCLFFGSIMTMSYNVNVKASTGIVLDALEKKEYEKIRQIFIKSSITQLTFGMVLLLLVWSSIDNVFSLIKPEYAVGKGVVIIIGIAKLYDLASGINSLILSYSKYYKYDSLIVISFVGLLYLLNYLLIPVLELEGAAYAALIATIYYNSVRNYLIWKFFKIHPYTKAQLMILIFGAIALGIGLLLPDFSGDLIIRLLSISYKSAILALVFGLMIYFSKVSAEINGVVDKIIKTGLRFFSK